MSDKISNRSSNPPVRPLLRPSGLPCGLCLRFCRKIRASKAGKAEHTKQKISLFHIWVCLVCTSSGCTRTVGMWQKGSSCFHRYLAEVCWVDKKSCLCSCRGLSSCTLLLWALLYMLQVLQISTQTYVYPAVGEKQSVYSELAACFTLVVKAEKLLNPLTAWLCSTMCA